MGRRGAILGTEDGTVEAWLNPIRLARDFRIAVFVDEALDPDLGVVRRCDKGSARVTLTIAGEPLQVTISPAFGTGAKLVTAGWNGSRINAPREITPSDTHFTIQTAAVPRIEAVIEVGEPAETQPVLVKPAPGDRAPSRR